MERKRSMHVKRIGDQLSVHRRYFCSNSRVSGSSTNAIQRSIAGKKAKPGKSLCEHHNKTDARTKINGKISGIVYQERKLVEFQSNEEIKNIILHLQQKSYGKAVKYIQI